MLSGQNIRVALQNAIRSVYLWRNLIAVAGIASMMLPWVYLDGAESSLSGAELIAYTFATSDERWDMTRQSFLGAAALFLVPLAVAVLSIAVFAKTFKEQHSIGLNAASGLLPALIVIFSASITSSEHLFFDRFVFPQAGIIVMLLCQTALALHSIVKHTP